MNKTIYTSTQRKKAHLFIIQLVFFLFERKNYAHFMCGKCHYFFLTMVFFSLYRIIWITWRQWRRRRCRRWRRRSLLKLDFQSYHISKSWYLLQNAICILLWDILFTSCQSCSLTFFLFSLEIVYFCVYIYVVSFSWKYVMVWCV